MGNNGIRAWLAESRHTLDPDTTVVVNLDAVGSGGGLTVSHREGLSSRLARSGIDRARSSAVVTGIPLPEVAIPNTTDAIEMTRAGVATISLASREHGWISNLHRVTDTIDRVDLDTVGQASALTEHIATSWAEQAVR